MGVLIKFVNILLEVVVLIVKFVFEWLKAIFLSLTPTSFIAKDISGQTVLITGAGGGLGHLLAKKFAEQGCHLVLWDKDEDLNQHTLASVLETGARAMALTVDLSQRDEIYANAEKVQREFGDVDILINNAGVVFGKPVLDSNDKQMELTVRVNTLAHFWMVKAFVPSMLERKVGHIVTIASSAGVVGVPGMADYCSSKFGAVGFEESLRQELKDTNIYTTLVCPYLINTSMFSGVKSRFPWVMDALSPEYVSSRIVKAVLRNQKSIVMPKQLHILFILKSIIPIKCQDLLSNFFGVNSMMSTFVGRNKKE